MPVPGAAIEETALHSAGGPPEITLQIDQVGSIKKHGSPLFSRGSAPSRLATPQTAMAPARGRVCDRVLQNG